MIRCLKSWRGLILGALAFLSSSMGARAGTVLTFEDVALPATGLGTAASPYLSQGYSLSATNGFSARGPGTDSANYTPDTSQGSGQVTTSLAAFAPATITLTRTDLTPFTLQSIDLAREFRFNTPDVGQAYPVVTFIGTQAGGGTVSQTFTADQADFYFRTFSFGSDFSNLLSVSWQQPSFTSGTPSDPAPGLHQFDNIELATVPEPAALLLLGTGAVGLLGYTARRARPAADAE